MFAHLESCVDLESGAVSESEVVAWYQTIIAASAMTTVTKQYALMSLTKLSTRFTQVTADIQHIIDGFGCHLDADLQQRGVEFGQLFRSQAAMRAQLLEPMPVLEKDKTLGGGAQQAAPTLMENGMSGVSVPEPAPSSGLMDLLGLDDGSSAGLLAQPSPAAAAPATSALDDILGLGGDSGVSAPAAAGLGLPSLLDMAAPAAAGQMTNGGLDSLLNGVDTSTYASPGPAEPPQLTAYDKNGLRVVFTFPSTSPTTTTILLLANNLTSGPIQDFVFQVRCCAQPCYCYQHF